MIRYAVFIFPFSKKPLCGVCLLTLCSSLGKEFKDGENPTSKFHSSVVICPRHLFSSCFLPTGSSSFLIFFSSKVLEEHSNLCQLYELISLLCSIVWWTWKFKFLVLLISICLSCVNKNKLLCLVLLTNLRKI